MDKPAPLCCLCREPLQDGETGYCEDCRYGGGDLEDLLDAALDAAGE